MGLLGLRVQCPHYDIAFPQQIEGAFRRVDANPLS